MLVKIRHNVFETNSSSVHTLCIADPGDYTDWCDGKPNIVYDMYDNKLVTAEEAKTNDDDFPYTVAHNEGKGYWDSCFIYYDKNGEEMYDPRYVTYEQYEDETSFYSHFDQETPDGQWVAFGYYGHD